MAFPNPGPSVAIHTALAPAFAWCMADRTAIDLGEGFTLSAQEAARAAAFRSEAARRDFLHGRGLARHLSTRECSGMALPEHDRDRPGSPSRLSWSRSGPLALAASTSGAPIGCDIERPRHLDWQAMLATVAAPQEAVLLTGHGQPLAVFYRLWTAKEALLKAFGTGFRADPRGIALPADFLTGSADTARIAARGEHWHIAALPVTGAVAAIALSLSSGPS